MVGTARDAPFAHPTESFQTASLADTASRSRRRFARGLTLNFPPSHNRGRRECRAPDAPAVLRAKVKSSTHASRHGHTGNTRHSPRNGFTAYFALSPGTGLFCPRRSREMQLRKNLTPASGCQDHTTLPSASSALVSHAISVHRIPRSTSVTIAKRPSVGRDDSRLLLFLPRRQVNFRNSEIGRRSVLGANGAKLAVA